MGFLRLKNHRQMYLQSAMNLPKTYHYHCILILLTSSALSPPGSWISAACRRLRADW